MAYFPADLTLRATVKITDKLLIHNIDTGVTQYTTVQKLLAALAIYGNVGIGTTTAGAYHGFTGGGLEISNATAPDLILTRGTSGAARISVNSVNDLVINVKNGASGSIDALTVLSNNGNVGNVPVPTSKLHIVGLPIYANNAAALAGGLTAGAFYRTNADPDPVCVVY